MEREGVFDGPHGGGKGFAEGDEALSRRAKTRGDGSGRRRRAYPTRRRCLPYVEVGGWVREAGTMDRAGVETRGWVTPRSTMRGERTVGPPLMGKRFPE